MPAGRLLWAHFGVRNFALCITTIRFSPARPSYVLNSVNKACRGDRI